MKSPTPAARKPHVAFNLLGESRSRGLGLSRKKTRANSFLLITAVAGLAWAAPLFAQGTAFTYQGRLNDGLAPANGLYDLKFTLFDSETNGDFYGPLTNSAVVISNGLFAVLLDFGPDAFSGHPNYFLEVAVHPGGGADFTTLSPRQRITPSPYARHAGTATTLFNGAVTRLNNLTNNVTLTAGANVTITPNGNTLTIGASGINPWTTVGTNITYISGNVGVGTSLPQAKVHVRGAAEGISINGPAGGDANQSFMSFRDSPGNRIGYVGDGSTGDASVFLNSDNGDVVLNTAAGRVLTAKPDGRVGIGTTAPQASLDVRGDILLGASRQIRAAGGEENLRIIRGTVGGGGTLLEGSGFSVSRVGDGDFRVTFNIPFGDVPAVTVTVGWNLQESRSANVYYNLGDDPNAVIRIHIENDENLFFNFIAIGPR